MAKSIERKAVAVGNNGHRTFMTTLPMGDIAQFTEVDLYDSSLPIDDPEQGYQREPEPRYKGFGKYLIENGTKATLTPLVLSGRDTKFDFDANRNIIKLSDKHKLYVVDGQHRIEGAKYAIYSKHADFLSTLEWPIEIIEGMTKLEEMKRFVEINSNAKSVRTDLVNSILTQRARKEGEDSIDDKDVWKVVVSHAVDEMNDNDPWTDRITMPNEHSFTKKEIEENAKLENQRLVRATSVMTSLKPIYAFAKEATGELSGSLQDQGKTLGNITLEFWRAVEAVNPELFKVPSDYVIQKTPGVFSLHGLLLHLMRDMYKGRRAWKKEEFMVMLDGAEDIFSPKYWSKKEGEAQKYGSMKGFAQLTKNLIDGLGR